MSKEIPYFKFFVSEWLLGRISDENYRVQGLFIVACSQYWHKECTMFLSELERKLGKSQAKLLVNSKYIDVNDDMIRIDFLDEQYAQFVDLQQKRSDAGRKGGKASSKQTLIKKEATPEHLEEEKSKRRVREDIEDSKEEEKENTSNLYSNEKFRHSSDNKVNKAAEMVCALFHITEIQHFRSFAVVYSCLELINKNYGMDAFIGQVDAYKEYKLLSGQDKHRFNRFLGNPIEQCEDGAWCSHDWRQVLADYKKKENPNEKEAPQVTRKEMVDKGK